LHFDTILPAADKTVLLCLWGEANVLHFLIRQDLFKVFAQADITFCSAYRKDPLVDIIIGIPFPDHFKTSIPIIPCTHSTGMLPWVRGF